MEMEKMAEFTITLDPKKNVFDILQNKFPNSGTPVSHAVDKNSTYHVTLESTVKYHNDTLPVKKAVIYNTSNDDPYGWFYVVSEGPYTPITTGQYGTKADTVYAFLIDITAGDNTGSATLTFKKQG